jgi:hypothetical protein
MSEDEQCGRWETTPQELKAEVRTLREMVSKLTLAIIHVEKNQVVTTPVVNNETLRTLVTEAQRLLVGKTD